MKTTKEGFLMTLAAKQKQHRTITVMAAVAVLVTAFLGYLYTFHFGDFFDRLYYYRFQKELPFSQGNFSVIIDYLFALLLIYYIAMTVLAVFIFLRRRRRAKTLRFFMAAIRLTTLIIMLVPGASFAFHYGFEILLEAVLLIHIARLTALSASVDKAIPALNKTILTGVVAEMIPLLRNIQCLPEDNMSVWGKLGFVLLPLATMFAFFAIGLYQVHLVRRPKRKPAPIVPIKAFQTPPATQEVSLRIIG